MSKNKLKRSGIFRNGIIVLGILVILIALLLANNHGQRQQKDKHGEGWEEEVMEDDFNAGDMIIEHIIDAHEWHILSYGDFHLAIPLPIIVYHDGKIHAFMSSKFHHGRDHFKGFGIAHLGDERGNVVRVLQDRFLDDKVIIHDVSQELLLDFSITKNVAALFMNLIFMTWLFIYIAQMYRKREGEAPKGVQSFLEPLILFVRDDIAKPSIGEKRYMKYMPYLLTLFFFIFFNNLFGLIPFFPGGVNVTGNITVTMMLALFTFVITTINANKNYWVHIINTPGVPWWLKFPVPLMPVVELIGVVIKPFVLMVRLFANITAGHIIVLGFICLIFIFGQVNAALGFGVSIVSVVFAIFMNFLELLVAFIQAYVFTLLSALYFGMATEECH